MPEAASICIQRARSIVFAPSEAAERAAAAKAQFPLPLANKNRLCSKTCGVDEKQNLVEGWGKLIYKKIKYNFIKRAGSHPEENS